MTVTACLCGEVWVWKIRDANEVKSVGKADGHVGSLAIRVTFVGRRRTSVSPRAIPMVTSSRLVSRRCLEQRWVEKEGSYLRCSSGFENLSHNPVAPRSFRSPYHS